MNQLSLFSDNQNYASLETAKEDCRHCQACGLSRTRDKVVFGAGNPTAKLMIIGQGPSQSDNGTGMPYSGPSGDVLEKGLARVGLSREQIWLTNIHKCLSYDAKNRKLRPPKADEVAACQPWLAAEIRLVSPFVIVCLGGPAAQTIINRRFKLNDQRGQWYTSQIGGIKTLATFQPAYLMRLKEWDRPKAVAGWHTFVADLEKVAQVLEGS